MTDTLKKEVTTKDLFLYACGSGTIGVNNTVFGGYLLVYYNQILGLNPALASLAISISLIFDAISDPLVGAWSDRVKTRIGRRHPFIYLSIVPLAICFYFLFSKPLYDSQTYLFWKLMILVILVRFAITFYETLQVFNSDNLPKISLLKFQLKTGRTHQIRVHMKYKGTCLVGDKQYRKKNLKFKNIDSEIKKKIEGLKGQVLHAKSLGFYHPTKEKIVNFESDLPQTFKKLLNLLKKLSD